MKKCITRSAHRAQNLYARRTHRCPVCFAGVARSWQNATSVALMYCALYIYYYLGYFYSIYIWNVTVSSSFQEFALGSRVVIKRMSVDVKSSVLLHYIRFYLVKLKRNNITTDARSKRIHVKALHTIIF